MEEQNETKEERKIRMARERAKKSYELRREEILKKKRDNYVPVEKKQKRGRKPIKKTYEPVSIDKKTKFTEDELIRLIMNDDDIKSEKTKLFHVNNIKRFFKNAECQDLTCLKSDYKLAVKRIEDSLNIYSGENLKPQTITHTFAGLLFAITKYASNLLPENIKKYLTDKFSEYILITNDSNKQKKEELVYPSFKTYLEKVKQKYGIESKEFLVASLYSEFTIRDDYGNAPILEKPLKTKEINYFVIKKKYVYFILNVYKTSNKYNTIKFTFSNNVSNLIKNYIKNNNINIGDILFNTNLSAFVSNMSKELGYADLGGINLFRHIRVSEIDGGATYQDKVALASQMGHIILTQDKYKNKIELKE